MYTNYGSPITNVVYILYITKLSLLLLYSRYVPLCDAGTPTGTAQRLIETQLKPGVADWNIVVPVSRVPLLNILEYGRVV